MHPPEMTVLDNIAGLWRSRGPQEAWYQLRLLVAVEPKPDEESLVSVLVSMGLEAAQLEETAFSRQCFQAAIALRPADAWLLYAAGRIASQHPDGAHYATHLLGWSVQVDPLDHRAAEALADALFILGDHQNAAAVNTTTRPRHTTSLTSEPPTSILDGCRVFVRLTPDPRLPNNAPEYQEAYHLDNVFGSAKTFWGTGPLFSETLTGFLGFAYSSDCRYFLKFEPDSQNSGRALLRLLPADFYKRMEFDKSAASIVLWQLGEKPNLDRINAAIDSGARFHVSIGWANGKWSQHPVALLFTYQSEKRLVIRTIPIRFPALLDVPQEDLSGCWDRFCNRAAGRDQLDAAAVHLHDRMMVGSYIIDSFGSLTVVGHLPSARTGPPSWVRLFMTS